VPKRRRNPDGSLVTPLSPAQEAALAKGREALAAKLAGQGEQPAVKGERRRSSVEVARVSKETGGGSKARKPSGGSKATSTRTKATSRPKSPAPRRADPVAKERGLLDRFGDWLSST
jgi:hypothetical protein